MASSTARGNPRRLGIVLLDEAQHRADFGLFGPGDETGVGCLPTGFAEAPGSWDVPTAYAVARGVADLNRAADRAAARTAVPAALELLVPHCSVVIADCGLFAMLSPEVPKPETAVVRLSGLELIDGVAAMTSGDIGVLTMMDGDLDLLLPGLPASERLRVLSAAKSPAWSRLARSMADPDYAARVASEFDGAELREELLAIVGDALREGGLWQRVAAVVVECTFMLQFADDIARLAGRPVLDVTSGLVARPRTGF